MSIQGDDAHICDGCGRGLGNGGVDKCAIVSRMDKETYGRVQNLHFCYDYESDDGKKVKGCEAKMLRPSLFAANKSAATKRKKETSESTEEPSSS